MDEGITMKSERVVEILRNEIRCINRRAKHECNGWDDCQTCDLVLPDLEIKSALKNAIKAVKRKSKVHGHWIICSDGYYPYCSVCKCEPKGREMTKFCGECGAKMDEE